MAGPNLVPLALTAAMPALTRSVMIRVRSQPRWPARSASTYPRLLRVYPIGNGAQRHSPALQQVYGVQHLDQRPS